MKGINPCRFCLSENCYKYVNNDYFYCGELENYCEMLSKTFDVILVKSNNKFICDDCSARLRDASIFKQQVLAAEKKLSEINEDIKDVDYDSDINLEEHLGHNRGSDEDIKIEDDFCDAKEETIISRTTKFDDSYKQCSDSESQEKDLEGIRVSKKNIAEIRRNGGPTAKLRRIKRAISKNEPESNLQKATKCQKDLRENTLKLITNSNLCLFTSLRTKFACYDCKETFLDIGDLREHSKTHSNAKEIKYKISRLTGLTYKNAEITDLKCSLCEDSSEDLDSLKLHLINKHCVSFGSDAGHLLIPYKLQNGFRCLYCHETFFTFTRLSIHMNSHSTSNVCEICGISYFNRRSLTNHIRSMHTEKKCSQCNLTFLTSASRTKHLRKTHNLGASRRHCLKCTTTFRYTHQLYEHMIVSHGAKRPAYNCEQCPKRFNTRNLLKIHVRNVHVRERNFPCSLCEMRFFTKCDRVRHERTHADVRSFSCDYCESRFKSKDSVRRHMKRQHGQGG